MVLLLLGGTWYYLSHDKAVNRKVENLTAFSRVYGYVKYFHPSDESRQIDWDKLAVLGANKVKEAKTDEELRNSLEALFLPIAPTIAFTETEPAGNSFLSAYLERIDRDTTGLKTVAWQHLGVDMQQKSHIYASSRTNRQDKVWNSHFYLYQNVNVPAQGTTGNMLRLSAMIKTKLNNQAGQGVLQLRLDDSTGRPLQTLSKTVSPASSDNWERYTIETEVDSQATQISVGVTLQRDGELWIDNIELETKNKEAGWTVLPLQNNRFEDQVYGRPIGWQSTVTGNYDYRVVSDKAMNGNSFYMGSKAVESPDFLFEAYPKVGETTIRQLAAGLWTEVPLALYSDKNHTLPRSSQSDFNRLKKELETINLSDATARNENVRLADIIIAWNELQHFYPYFEVIDTDWEKQLSASLKKTSSDRTQKEFYATLSSMLASAHDGHISLSHPSISNEAGLPFLVDWIEDKVVVTHSLHKEIRRGDIIKTLDRVPAAEIVQNQKDYISGSPQLSLFRSLRKFGTGKPGTEAVVEIEGEDEAKTYSIQRSSSYSNSKIEKSHLPISGEIENGIYYVNLDRASMDRINNEMGKIASSPGVIFDLRGHPNGNHQLISHLLTEQDTSGQWMQTPRIIYPDQQNIVGYLKQGWHLKPSKPHIKGEVVFITDARAISYAESFMSFIEHYELAEIVGQPTAGTNGGMITLVLPGGYRFGWTGMKVVKHDGARHHLIGIQPTIPVKKTLEGVREGKDLFLQEAIQVLNKAGSK